MPSTRRIGIIGCGNAVQHGHLPVLMSLDDVEPCWIADVDEARGRQLAKASGIPFYKYNSDLADIPPVDIILIAIPWGARKGVYEQLSKLGKEKPNLFVEKPFARSLEEHHAILAPYRAEQVAVGLMRRSLGIVQCAQSIVDDQLFGPVQGVEVSFGGLGRILTGGAYGSNLALAGGGTLFEMGVHYIDAALFCLRAVDVWLHKKKVIYHEGFDVHVDANIAVLNSSGCEIPMRVKITNLEATNTIIRLIFQTASVEFDISGEDEIRVHARRAGGAAYKMRVAPSWGPREPFAQIAQHWKRYLEALDTQKPNFTCAFTAVLTTKIVERIYDQQPE